MSGTLAYHARKRAALADSYRALRKAHGPRAGVAQQLKRATTRVLEVQLAEERRAARLQANAGTLAGDLDLFLNR
ncbi:hypothetical protein [Ancylobacter moscoviensis]